MQKTIIYLIWICILIMSAVVVGAQPATPIPVQPPTGTPTPLPPTEPPTRTPTSEGPASIEALNEGTNVRAQPDITSDIVVKISPGTNYPILGRFFEWYQLSIPEAGGGTGWIHQSVIRVLGDENLIPDLNAAEIPTQDPIIEQRQQTSEAITATPGAVLTLTVLAQVTPTSDAPIPGNAGDVQSQIQSFGGTLPPTPIGGGAVNPNTVGDPNVLPTFTFPAETATPINLGELSVSNAEQAEGLPPIAPIMGLVALGGLGLFLTLLRR